MRFPRPPGAILLAAGIGAGLVTGLSRFGDPVITIPVLLMAAWAVRTQWWWPALPALAAGVALGRHAVATDAASCAGQLSQGKVTLQVRLIDPAGGNGRVHPLLGECEGVVTARWPVGSRQPAGLDLPIEGKWLPRSGPFGRHEGLLLVYTVRPSNRVVSTTPGLVSRFRSYLADASVRLYGKRAPLVDALVTGRRGELDPELRAAFASAGLIHLLAISGFHVGLLAGWVALLLTLCKAPRRTAEIGATLAALGYAAFLGWPAPASRAAVLIFLYAWSRRRQRHPQIGALFAASIVPLLLLDPWAITEVGAWLSVVALAGLTVATRWSDRAISEANWVRLVSASLGATLFTAPLTAFVFGQVAPVAIILGLIAAPLASLLQPAIMASLALAKLAPFLAGALAASGGVLLEFFEALVRIGGTAPGAAVAQDPGLRVALPWVLLLVVGLWATHGRSTRQVAGFRLARAATAGCWVLLVVHWPTLGLNHPGELGLFFLDVGQGDAALIRTPGGHWVAIDVGPRTPRWDAGAKVVAPFLARQGVDHLELLVASHAHRDHIGGAEGLLNRISAKVVLEPGEAFLDEGYLEWLDLIAKDGIRWRMALPGLAWEIDGVSFTVLHPPRIWAHRGEDLNEDSIVLEVRYGNFAALFSGDAGFPAESLYAPEVGHLDLLKVGHHGSRGATSELLLRATTPHTAIISVGENNYGHPSPDALGRLQRSGAQILRTDQEGTITVRTDGHTVNVRGSTTSSSYIATGTPPGR